MFNIIVFGYGQMGRSICKGLKRIDQDSCIYAVDNNIPTDMDNWHSSPYHDHYIMMDTQKSKKTRELLEKIKPQLVVSAMPYFCNWVVASHCILMGIPYCDLGGHVKTSNDIKKMANKEHSLVLTDLGLAPGWVNILAAKIMSRWEGEAPYRINMFCGGLPSIPVEGDPFKYFPTWSVDGLINEYKDDVEFLVDGEIRTRRSLQGYGKTKVLDTTFECFETSGGASHSLRELQQQGVSEASYRTLRYEGHRDLINDLIHEHAVPDKELKTRLTTNAYMYKDVSDMVVLKAEAWGYELGHDKEERMIIGNSDGTAMQKATAYPCAAVAHWLGKNADKLDRRALGYKDIDYHTFQANMQKAFNEINKS